MSMDDVKSGQRINCNGVCGTIIGKPQEKDGRSAEGSAEGYPVSRGQRPSLFFLVIH